MCANLLPSGQYTSKSPSWNGKQINETIKCQIAIENNFLFIVGAQVFF